MTGRFIFRELSGYRRLVPPSWAAEMSSSCGINAAADGTHPLDPQPNFENGPEAFRWKTTWEICRALGVLRMCSVDTLVNHSLQIMTCCQRTFGTRALGVLLRPTIYKQFVGGETPDEISACVQRLRKLGVHPMLACTLEEDVGEEGHEDVYDRNCAKIMDILEMSKHFSSTLPLFQLKLSGFFPANLLTVIGGIYRQSEKKESLVTGIAEGLTGDAIQMGLFCDVLTDKQQKSLQLGIGRLKKIGEEAFRSGIRLLVDAEFTYLNSGLSLLTLSMMAAFNQTIPSVWNTYQCYLKDAVENLSLELSLTQQLGVCFGAKIVRGAYMDQERTRARNSGYPDPICDNYEATCDNYNRVLGMMLENVRHAGPARCNIIVASHNVESIKFAMTRLADLKIDRQLGGVYFGQLYGMCDQVTFPLANANYTVYKSIPYGTVEEVLPYLARRASENRSVLEGCRKEQELLWKEFKARLTKRITCRTHIQGTVTS